jgi:hypothetical protein
MFNEEGVQQCVSFVGHHHQCWCQHNTTEGVSTRSSSTAALARTCHAGSASACALCAPSLNNK